MSRVLNFGEFVLPSGRYRATLETEGNIKFPQQDSTFLITTHWIGYSGGSINTAGLNLSVTGAAILQSEDYFNPIIRYVYYRLRMNVISVTGTVTIYGDNSQLIGTFNSTGSKEFFFFGYTHGAKLILSNPGNTFTVDDIYLEPVNQPKLVEWGVMDFGSSGQNPTYINVPEFSWKFTISGELVQKVELVDTLRRAGGKLIVEKFTGTIWEEYTRGTIVREEVQFQKLTGVINVTIANPVQLAGGAITKSSNSDILETRETFTQWLENYCGGQNGMAPEVVWVSKWYVLDEEDNQPEFKDLLIEKRLWIRIGSDFNSYGDFLHALLDSIASYILHGPFNKLYVLPFTPNGGTKYQIPVRDIISHSWGTESKIDRMKFRRRSSYLVDYSDEVYTEGEYPSFFEDEPDVSLTFPFTLAPAYDERNEMGLDPGFSNSVFAPDGKYVKLNSVTTLDRYGVEYVHPDPSSRNFFNLPIDLFWTTYNKEQVIHNLVIRGIDHEIWRLWEFPAAAYGQYYSFVGAVFRVRRYVLDHEQNLTRVELVKV